MKLKIWHTVALCSFLFILLGSGCSIGIMYSWWRQTAVNAWNKEANSTQQAVMRVLQENLDFVRFAASSVAIFNPTGAVPAELVRMFRAYDDASPYTIGSIGMLQRAPNTTTGKYSWQLALGFGCPRYIYAYADATTPYPTFLGHCTLGEAVNWTDSAYVGSDWGLKPEEIKLTSGTLPYTFLPIFNLLDQFTLTYETALNGTVSFAELNLATFSSYVANNVTANVYVYETTGSGGPLIAASKVEVVVNGTRALAATLPGYNGTTSSNWHTVATRYQDTGLDWTIVTYKSDWDVYSDLYYLTGIAVGVSVAVAIVIATLAAVLTGMVTRREVAYLHGRVMDPEHTPLNSDRSFEETSRLALAIETSKTTVHL